MRKQLSTAKAWPFLWVLSLTTILIGSFLPDDAPASKAMSSVWWNLAHVPAYAIFAFSTLMVVSNKIRMTYFLILLTGVAVGLFSLGIELLQPSFGRMLSVVDFCYNFIGVLIALSAFVLLKRLSVFASPDRD